MSPLDQFRGSASRDQHETLLAALPWAERHARITGPQLLMLGIGIAMAGCGLLWGAL
jgi:hypothetical protein